MSKPKTLPDLDPRTSAMLGSVSEITRDRMQLAIPAKVDPALAALLWRLHQARQMEPKPITLEALKADEDLLARVVKFATRIGDHALFSQMAHILELLEKKPVPQFLKYYIEAACRYTAGDKQPEAAEITELVNSALVSEGYPEVSLQLVVNHMKAIGIDKKPGKNSKPGR